ncbi:hypothetical protein [Streptomyces sp. NPDC005955]|uniref:hypothetical protein n=1 Tax=Streptomyces sp. NPDC005955 TaxID=3364738 RepID=UPI0036941374
MSQGQPEHLRIICPPAAATLGTDDHRSGSEWLSSRRPGQVFMMGDNPALPVMPERPTLADFFRLRFAFDPFAVRHMLHSARRAREQGMGDKVVLACLLHDVALAGLLRSQHGHWGAQLVEPYVDEEVAWAIRQHEVLRYFPDESVGYGYPEAYRDFFGAEYQPPAHTRAAYAKARRHRWYMSARMVTVNDVYTFDSEVDIEFAEFEDVVGRHFAQPAQGLGFDDSPVAHMWRTMIWPNNFI